MLLNLFSLFRYNCPQRFCKEETYWIIVSMVFSRNHKNNCFHDEVIAIALYSSVCGGNFVDSVVNYFAAFSISVTKGEETVLIETTTQR